MPTPTLKREAPMLAGFTASQDFGNAEQRLSFVLHLREHHRFTLEDLADKSMYSVETVKAWFSDNPQRRRECQPRAVALLLQSLGLSQADFWTIVTA